MQRKKWKTNVKNSFALQLLPLLLLLLMLLLLLIISLRWKLRDETETDFCILFAFFFLNKKTFALKCVSKFQVFPRIEWKKNRCTHIIRLFSFYLFSFFYFSFISLKQHLYECNAKHVYVSFVWFIRIIFLFFFIFLITLMHLLFFVSFSFVVLFIAYCCSLFVSS